MIQRIQTLFLLAAFCLIGSLFFMPFVKLLGMNNEFYELSITEVNKIVAGGETTIMKNTALSILIAVIVLLIFSTMYKNTGHRERDDSFLLLLA